MKKLFFAILIISFALTTTVQAGGFKGFSLGAGGGITNYKTPTFEGFFQVNLELGKLPFQPKLGFVYHSYETDFDRLNNLDANSLGIFAEATIFPFQKYLFTGLRWELLNINWFSDNSARRMEYEYGTTTIYSGTSFFAIAGVEFPISDWLNFRLYAMPGVQEYRLSDAEFYSGDYMYNGSIMETHVEFVFQLNASLGFRLFEKKSN